MANITLEGVAEVVKIELEPVNTSLVAIEEVLAQHTKTLDTHTRALDTLLKERKIKSDEKDVSVDRLTNLELWAKEASKKLGIKFDL
jgi:hypothetical protein